MTAIFSELIKSDTPTLVDFFADWCEPCKAMKPILEALKSTMGEKIKIIKVDVDVSPQVANIYHIQGIPTLILFRNGEIKWRQAGVVSAQNLERIIQQHLS
ncbi:MAG: thioredoxin [Chitinophagales bacterium]